MKILSECNLSEVVVEILNGETIVFPTETTYGLGCDATNQKSVDKIFKIKGRKSDKPLLVVVPTVEMAKKYLKWNDTLDKLAKKYWPGALTIIGEYKRDLSPTLSFAKERETRPSPPQRRGQGEVSLTEQEKRFFSFERVAGYIGNLVFRRQLRQDATKAEKILWQNLRNKRFGGLKFKRQHGIGPFIVDFYHPESRTIIEIDGDIHFVEDLNIQKDKDRELWFKKNGYRILRYNNVDIYGNLDWILREIYHELAEVPAIPLSNSMANAIPLSNSLLCEGERDATLASTEERAGRGLASAAFIRELHTYGQLIRIGKYDKTSSQHQGLGKKLLKEAEKIAKKNHCAEINVISGVGVRDYYRSLGYRLRKTYMVKKI